MNFLVISGAPQTGKTTAINKIALWLTTGVVNTDIYGNPLPPFTVNQHGVYNDISVVVMLKGKKVIIHSASDDMERIDELIVLLKAHPDTEVVITSSRDLYWPRDYFTRDVRPFATFFLESPLGKITRRNNFHLADQWYKDTLLELHQHILRGGPFYL